MTLTVQVRVPDSAQYHAEIIALDLDAAGAAIASQRTVVERGKLATFHPHATRTIQVVEARSSASWAGDVLDGRALDFSDALRALKAGNPCARAGWHGRGAFVVMTPPLFLPPFNTQDTARKVNDLTAKWIGEDQPLDCQPYFAMYTARKQWQPGWLASQADLLADDWLVLPQIATPVIELPVGSSAGAPALPASSR